MSEPRRIQRKRTKGWKMPANTVYVGRPTKWGNPFTVDATHDRFDAVRSFRTMVLSYLGNGIGYPLRELRGKNLACWCPLHEPCHVDVLLELANPELTKRKPATSHPWRQGGERKPPTFPSGSEQKP